MNHFRPLLATYAYNITGSYEAALDIVQDAFERFLQADTSGISNEKAYLIRSVINLSINFKKQSLRSAHLYKGVWLPEPVDTEGPDTALSKKEVLSYSLMVLMEKLNPRQRAVFILKEAFDYSHDEIASVLEITVENSRQLLKRAKQALQNSEYRTKKDVEKELLSKYVSVIGSGNVSDLELMLKEDIVVMSDGGGKVRAATKPVFGRDAVFKFLKGIHLKFFSKRSFKMGRVNHQPAVFHYEDGEIVSCQILEMETAGIANIFVIRNPDKLSRFAGRDCL